MPTLEMPPEPYAGDPLSWLSVVFRKLEGWPGYGVDTDGNVWSCWRLGPGAKGFSDAWRKLKPGGGKYLHVHLRKNGRSYSVRVHKLVAETFLGPCPPGKETCHRDDNPRNNRLSNLRWDTHKSNCVDRRRNGRHPIGSQSVLARYDEETIAKAKGLLNEGIRVGAVASVCGINRPTVSLLKAGLIWTHVLPLHDDGLLQQAVRLQSHGSRWNVWLECRGQRMIVQDWARHLGISSVTIRSRLSRGWPVERALSPLNHKFKAAPRRFTFNGD